MATSALMWRRPGGGPRGGPGEGLGEAEAAGERHFAFWSFPGFSQILHDFLDFHWISLIFIDFIDFH